MVQNYEHNYFFSIQPFWNHLNPDSLITSPDGRISVCSYHWGQDHLPCVPGNGQVGIMLQGPEDFSGRCYGVLDSPGDLPLYGKSEGCLVRFSPGSFSKISNIPVKLIDPCGVPLEDIFTREQLSKIIDAMAAPIPSLALIQLFLGWSEQNDTSPLWEQELVKQITQLIWSSHGNIRIRDLEKNTLYSGRYLQEVTGRKVGISPKQMCRQVRFQNALRLLQSAQGINLCSIAQTLGYSDQAHFSKEFKSFSGVSPSLFQRENCQKVDAAELNEPSPD